MIGLKLQGRLGNQLFQFAFIYTTAKKLRTSFYIDQSAQKFLVYKYFNLSYAVNLIPPDSDSKNREKVTFLPSFLKGYYLRLIRKVLQSNKLCFPADVHIEDVTKALKNFRLYEGFFLSECYFTEQAATLQQFFSVKDRFKAAYNDKYASMLKDKRIITVHIRKDDYLNLGHLNLGSDDLSLPVEYYHHILPQLQSADALFLFISDDAAFVQNEFSYIENKIISKDDMIFDFQHLLNADICVIANSTFSWWGAYLNNKAHKKIYAPEFFLGHVVNRPWPKDIYPGDWELINVKRLLTE